MSSAGSNDPFGLNIKSDTFSVDSAASQLHGWQKELYEEKKTDTSHIGTARLNGRDGLVIARAGGQGGSTILFLDDDNRSKAGCDHANADSLLTKEDVRGTRKVCPTCESDFSFIEAAMAPELRAMLHAMTLSRMSGGNGN